MSLVKYTSEEKIAIAVFGFSGLIANIAAVVHRWKTPGLASRLYVVLGLFDMITCLIMVFQLSGIKSMNYVLYANQASAVWTCVISATRLIAVSTPFYRINQRILWVVSLLVTAGATVLSWLIFLKYFYALIVLSGIDLVVILIITIWTCVSLRRGSFVSETDRAKRKATKTILIIAILFLITNSFGFIVPLFYLFPGTFHLYISCAKAWPFIISLNSVVNPVVILSHGCEGAQCCGQRQLSNSTTKRENNAAEISVPEIKSDSFKGYVYDISSCVGNQSLRNRSELLSTNVLNRNRSSFFTSSGTLKNAGIIHIVSLRCYYEPLRYLYQEPTETNKKPIKTRYLGYMTGYQPIRDQYFLIRSVPEKKQIRRRPCLTYLLYSSRSSEPTETNKKPIKTRYLGYMTGYQPIRDQYFLIRSVPEKKKKKQIRRRPCLTYLLYSSRSSVLQGAGKGGVTSLPSFGNAVPPTLRAR
eukprot:sb/3464372/